MKYVVVRTSQMRFTINNLRVTFLPTDTSKGGVGPYDEDTDLFLPKIEARYDLKADWGVLNFIAGYQTYKAVNDVDPDQTINSWVVGLRGKFNLGRAYLNGSLTFRQNGSNYGSSSNVDENAAWAADSLDDAEAFGFVGALGYKVSNRVTLEASCGWVESKFDNRKGEDDSSAIGFLVKFTVAPGVTIQPELIFQDNGDGWGRTPTYEKVDQGESTILGVWWKIDFK